MLNRITYLALFQGPHSRYRYNSIFLSFFFLDNLLGGCVFLVRYYQRWQGGGGADIDEDADLDLKDGQTTRVYAMHIVLQGGGRGTPKTDAEYHCYSTSWKCLFSGMRLCVARFQEQSYHH